MFVKFVQNMIVVLILTVSLHPIEANSPQDKVQLSREIASFIQKLDADSIRERMAAKRGLLKFGPKILPFLPRNLDRFSVNTTKILKEIRKSLQREKAIKSLQPSRVNLKKQAPLQIVLEKIARQSKNRIDSGSLSRKTLEKIVSVDFQNRKFWEAMDILAKKHAFDYASGKTGFALKLIPGSSSNEKTIHTVNYSGAVRFEVQNIRVFPFLGDQSKSMLRLEFVSRIEPRLRPLFLQYKGSNQHLKIGKTAISAFQSGSNFELPYGEGGQKMSFHLDFVVPKGKVPDTFDLLGNFEFTVAAGEETFRFEKSRIPQTLKQVDVTVQTQSAHFTRTTKNEGKLGVRIEVSYETLGPEFESHRTWMFHNRAYLETNDRKMILHNGKINTLLQADGAIQVEYNFEHVPENLKDLRFVYLAPTLVVDVPMKVNINRLTLEKPKGR